jgi:hypothetical protein
MRTRMHTSEDGLTLLITLLLMGVLLAVTASLVNITLKQYQFSGISYDSEVAFQSANAGMECVLYNDWEAGEFNLSERRGRISCFNSVSSADLAGAPGGSVSSGDERRYQFEWGTPVICTDVSIYKFYNAAVDIEMVVDGIAIRKGQPCRAGTTCTFIQARGYNVSCEDIGESPRVVEREYSVLY